jgi:Ubiquitin carboxyl-terminal hydrolase/Zn-finger in ubiquitin-hydrolases and other protein
MRNAVAISPCDHIIMKQPTSTATKNKRAKINHYLLQEQLPNVVAIGASLKTASSSSASSSATDAAASSSSDTRYVTASDHVAELSLEMCRCTHLQEFLPHILDLELCRAVHSKRGWVMANPVHALHLQSSQIEESTPSSTHLKQQPPLLYGDEQQRTNALQTEGIVEYWCPLDGYSAVIHDDTALEKMEHWPTLHAIHGSAATTTTGGSSSSAAAAGAAGTLGTNPSRGASRRTSKTKLKCKAAGTVIKPKAPMLVPSTVPPTAPLILPPKIPTVSVVATPLAESTAADSMNVVSSSVSTQFSSGLLSSAASVVPLEPASDASAKQNPTATTAGATTGATTSAPTTIPATANSESSAKATAATAGTTGGAEPCKVTVAVAFEDDPPRPGTDATVPAEEAATPPDKDDAAAVSKTSLPVVTLSSGIQVDAKVGASWTAAASAGTGKVEAGSDPPTRATMEPSISTESSVLGTFPPTAERKDDDLPPRSNESDQIGTGGVINTDGHAPPAATASSSQGDNEKNDVDDPRRSGDPAQASVAATTVQQADPGESNQDTSVAAEVKGDDVNTSEVEIHDSSAIKTSTTASTTATSTTSIPLKSDGNAEGVKDYDSKTKARKAPSDRIGKDWEGKSKPETVEKVDSVTSQPQVEEASLVSGSVKSDWDPESGVEPRITTTDAIEKETDANESATATKIDEGIETTKVGNHGDDEPTCKDDKSDDEAKPKDVEQGSQKGLELDTRGESTNPKEPQSSSAESEGNGSEEKESLPSDAVAVDSVPKPESRSAAALPYVAEDCHPMGIDAFSKNTNNSGQKIESHDRIGAEGQPSGSDDAPLVVTSAGKAWSIGTPPPSMAAPVAGTAGSETMAIPAIPAVSVDAAGVTSSEADRASVPPKVELVAPTSSVRDVKPSIAILEKANMKANAQSLGTVSSPAPGQHFLPPTEMDPQLRHLRLEEDRIRLIRRSLSLKRSPKRPDSPKETNKKKRRRDSDLQKTNGIPGWRASAPKELNSQQEQEWKEASREASETVELWMDQYRICLESYWDERERLDRAKSRQQLHFGNLGASPAIEMSSCQWCVTQANRFPRRTTPKKEHRKFYGDELMHCLQCSFVGCSPPSLAPGTKSHMAQHLLVSGHKFAVSCGEKAEIFCFQCGDCVYHEVFEKERIRIACSKKFPFLAWKQYPVLRSFDAFQFMKTEDHGIVWRGLIGTYPSIVPREHLCSVQLTLRRQALFDGRVQEPWILPNSNAIGLAASQNFKKKEERYKIVAPVGIYNLGNTCFMSAILQCLIFCTPLQQYFLRDVGHHHTSCEIYRRKERSTSPAVTMKSSKVSSGTSAKTFKKGVAVVCLACEMDRLFVSYFGSTIGKDILTIIDEASRELLSMGNPIDPPTSTDVDDVPRVERGDPLIISDLLTSAWKSGGMKHLAGYDQRDAHEFLDAFLELLGKDIVKYRGRIYSAVTKVVADSAMVPKPEKKEVGRFV